MVCVTTEQTSVMQPHMTATLSVEVYLPQSSCVLKNLNLNKKHGAQIISKEEEIPKENNRKVNTLILFVAFSQFMYNFNIL
ncbi:hypothetical protein OUZ56_017789 [Daphnia magna]|uniref:Uncharacterized protein n=1 Tax=Daphnia magna TaxID=35525 RepID=A0ABR0ATY0_9CRUS|nr:hypothetical protein OUZ56_017789 [Daphnia magna]